MTDTETVSAKPQLVASRLHLAVFLWIQLAMAASGGTVLRRFLLTADPESLHWRRVCYYLLVLALEWILLCYVWIGVKKGGSSLRSLIGGRWNSLWSVIRDFGIGVIAWFLWMAAIAFIAKTFPIGHRPSDAVLALLPTNLQEVALWLLLSASAGFCEETMYRGYLQQQFHAMTGSVPAATIMQGLLFGIVHSYQGIYAVVAIAIMGVVFGALATWRKHLRSNMVAHAWYDAFVGVIAYLSRFAHHR